MLWDNNQGDYEYFTKEAKEWKEAGDTVNDFAEFLKYSYEELKEMVVKGYPTTEEGKNMVFDVGSDWRVNWTEIAQAYYDEVEEC